MSAVDEIVEKELDWFFDVPVREAREAARSAVLAALELARSKCDAVIERLRRGRPEGAWPDEAIGASMCRDAIDALIRGDE